MRQASLIFIASLLLGVLLLSNASPAEAGTITLNNNSGTSSSAFFVDGEPTLVMNGFDLNALNVGAVEMDVVTIAVQKVVDAPIQVVIYGDSNGGSPVDATLIYQTEVRITTAGTAFIPLPQRVAVNYPVVWVGFYLPTGFRFFGDTSGTSVLTYWAWTANSTFDLSNLGSAGVFGPANGTAPVSIDMGGVARITAEVTPVGSNGFRGDGLNDEGEPVGIQIEGNDADLSVLSLYTYCGDRLLYDPQDIRISAQSRFSLECRADLGSFSPGEFVNVDDLPANVPTYERRGFFYEVFVPGGETAPNSSEELLVPVTHCMRPEQGELPSAVIGVAYGAPRAWEILPTVRYNEWICAEVTHAGFLSYFVPRTGEEPNLNADLYFVGVVYLDPQESSSSERGLLCGYNYIVKYAIHNEGFVETPPSIVRVEMKSVRTGQISQSRDFHLPAIGGGETVNFEYRGFTAPTTFINESHIIRVTIDPSNTIAELNENNNGFAFPNTLVLRTARC
jgi:hypothetical protein